MFDSLLLFTYGGPETEAEIRPFVQSVLPENTPESRIEAAAAKYQLLGGTSPLNAQSRALIVRLLNRIKQRNESIPVYWATLHSSPPVNETVSQMIQDGRKNAAVFVPAPLESQYMKKKYRAALDAALNSVSSEELKFHFLPPYWQTEEFIQAQAKSISKGLKRLAEQGESNVTVIFTAHSLPKAWEESALYDTNFQNTINAVVKQAGLKPERAIKAYQSKPDGAPGEWLSPEPGDVIWNLKNQVLCPAVLLVPLGFSLDNMEVAYDLDYQMGVLCNELNYPFFRAPTAAAEDEFIDMIINLVIKLG